MHRRKFIAGVAASTMAVAVAGCSGNGGQGSPEDVTRAYWTADDVDEAEDLLHPESPLEISGEFAEEMQERQDYQETEVIAEDVDSEDLQEEGINSELSNDEIDEIAEDEEITVTNAVLEIDGEEWKEPVITATHDGDWYILDTPGHQVTVG